MSTVRRRQLPEPEELAAGVARGEHWAVATSLNLLDNGLPEARRQAARLLNLLPSIDNKAPGHLIGLTGPPGAGKSSLTSALIGLWRQRGLRIGILAVDPSSPISGGALLGDRLRMLANDADNGVFIRSLACRGEVGGLSPEVWPMSLLMLAAFDIVLVETVGVGQKEIDVSKMTDTTCFVAQPASGDSIQFLKAGIMEIPDILVVNKEDIGAAARKTFAELQTTLRRPSTATDNWSVPVLSVSATRGSGIEALVNALEHHRNWLAECGSLTTCRRHFQAQWVLKRLREQFGQFGIDKLGGETQLLKSISRQNASPYDLYALFRDQLLSHWN